MAGSTNSTLFFLCRIDIMHSEVGRQPRRLFRGTARPLAFRFLISGSVRFSIKVRRAFAGNVSPAGITTRSNREALSRVGSASSSAERRVTSSPVSRRIVAMASGEETPGLVV